MKSGYFRPCERLQSVYILLQLIQSETDKRVTQALKTQELYNNVIVCYSKIVEKNFFTIYNKDEIYLESLF